MLRFVLALCASVLTIVCLLVLFGIGVAWSVRPASAAVGAEDFSSSIVTFHIHTLFTSVLPRVIGGPVGERQGNDGSAADRP